jgi:hypothetical protein
MSSWLETYKPTASSRFQLWLAGAMWTAVGIALTFVGGHWLLTTDGYKILILTAVAVCLGIGKSFFVLERAAHNFVSRIQLRGEGKCVGGFLSVKGWALVGGMVLLGRLLRSVGIPRPILGLVYAGVGLGMVISSRIFWRAWLRSRQ